MRLITIRFLYTCVYIIRLFIAPGATITTCVIGWGGWKTVETTLGEWIVVKKTNYQWFPCVSWITGMLNNVKVTFSLYDRRWNIINKPSHVRERIPNALFFFLFYFVRPFSIQARFVFTCCDIPDEVETGLRSLLLLLFFLRTLFSHYIVSYYYHTAFLF